VKKLRRKFETVLLADVLKEAVEVDDEEGIRITPKKDGHHTVQRNGSTDVQHEPPIRRELQLLVVQSEDARLKPQAETPTALKTAVKRVLVVDDECCIADTLTAIFRSAGYEAVASYDGLSALDQCESFQPDLVVTDVVMPGMNGIEMAILMKQRHPSCKVLLFSGQAATADLLEEARRSGHDFELLAKPVHPSELLAKLAS
jgi:CheY-like chemotaxis protein